MLMAAQVFSSLGIGLLVGILLGLSSAPVVGLVVGSITALLASLLGFNLPTKERAENASGNQLPQAMVQMLIALRAGTFGFACVAGIFIGIYMRTHDVLSPPARGLEARYAELLAVGFDPEQARALLVSPSGAPPAAGDSEPNTRQTVLFRIDAENCSQLGEDRFASLAAAAAYYRGRDLDWLADIAEGLDAGLDDEAQKRRALAAVVNVACRAD
jgi:alkylhydroperoxidase family enzyme